MQFFKNIIRGLLPSGMVDWTRRVRAKRMERRFQGKDAREVFSAIYAEGMWGNDSGGAFCSGTGSRDEDVVAPYVTAVEGVVERLPRPLTAVDLGCGDFSVGQRLFQQFDHYVACDVVPELIEHHRGRFAGEKLEFRCLDLVEDDLPAADVAIIRQVLQHLSNADVARVALKLRNYPRVIVTEHVPADPFEPNREKATGPGIRVAKGSGIDLAAPPFSISPTRTEEICAVPSDGGIIRTTLYEFDRLAPADARSGR